MSSIFFNIKGVGLLPSLARFIIYSNLSLWLEIRSPNDFVVDLRRLFTFGVLFILFTSLMLWNHIGFLIDDIIFPDWSRQNVSKPLFIVGNARSGTTWVHRVIVSMDEGKFTTFRTWEIMFGVSVTWRKLILWSYEQDKYIGSPLLRLITYLERRIIGVIHVHQVGLQEPEEDEWIMSHVCLSQLMCLFYPQGSSVIMPLIMFDQELSKYFQTLIFDYYFKCIQKHLYCRDVKGNMVFVSKNPAFTLRLNSLYYRFPDARVVCLLRDPMQSIPSMVSYISQVLGTRRKYMIHNCIACIY